jgi:hypothetical protein
MKRERIAAIVVGSAMVGGVVVAMATAQLGPLNPPPGAVMDTGPSLADLQGGTGLPGGLVEYEVFLAPASGDAADQLEAILVEPGRVYIKSIVAHRSYVAVFDGFGEIESGARVVGTNPAVARLSTVLSFAGNGGARNSSSQIEVGVVVENGLYAAWDITAGTAFVQVVYLPLD